MKTAEQLRDRILALIARGVEYPTSDDEFNELALELFAFQFGHNEIYRGWCERQKLTPATVIYWKQVPTVPTSAFKDFALTCFPVEEAVAEFHTSGTTQGKSGKHYFKTLELYDAAIVPNFDAHLLSNRVGTDHRAVGSEYYLQLVSPLSNQSTPKRGLQTSARPAVTPRLFILTPSPNEAPRSSFSHMMEVVRENVKNDDRGWRMESPFFVRHGKLEVERLAADLSSAQKSKQPTLLLGTAFSFVHFFDYCERKKLSFNLSEGCRAMETGGFKGKSREVPKQELYSLFEEYLGIPPQRVVNEYGMTELSTQFYDITLRSDLRHPDLKSEINNLKSIPPWTRVMIIDPTTGQEAREGERGLIRILDLANLYSVMAIQTEDVGILRADGFEVCGRATGAEARGCSVAADEMIGERMNDQR